MQKCFYHTKADSTGMCIGCKMPICDDCQTDKKGFCESCLKKVASLGEKIQDMKKTGMVSNMKATMIKSSSRPTALKNVTYCFHHFDVVAAGTCPTCNRPFCPNCLDPSGQCTHCAAHEEEVVEEAPYQPVERPVRPAAPAARPARPVVAKKKGNPTPVAFYIGIAAIILFVGYNWTKRGASPKPPVPAAGVNDTRAHGTVTGGQGPVSVAIAAPAAGETVSGIATIKADVTGSPERIELLVDGEWQGAVNAAPYHFQWASQAVPNGTHKVTLVAVSAAGEKSETSVQLEVKN